MMENKIRVLYVDDEHTLLDLGKLFLERTGDFSVTLIDSASDALDLLQTEKFDAIVSDYQMPEMDGIAFLKQLKALGHPTPFILFTGRGREVVVIEALNEGAAFYLQKGGEPKSQFVELSHKIRQAVSRKRAEDALRASEDKFSKTFQSSPDLILLTSIPEGKILEVNESVLRITGYTQEEVQGRTIDELGFWVDGADREQYKACIRAEGKVLNFPTRFRQKSDAIITAWISGSIVSLESGPCFISVVNDITDRKRAEDALRESELFLKETQQIARLGGWKANPHTDYLGWTDGIYDIVEAPREYRPGLTEGMKYYAPEDIPVIREKMAACLATGEPFSIEVQIITETGKKVWTELRGLAPVIEGTRSYVVGTLQDITERKLVEKSLREGRRQLNSMATNIPGVVYRFCVTPDGTYGFDYISEHSWQILGLENDPVTFFSRITDGIVPEDRERFISSVQHAISTKTLWEFDGWYVKPSGKKIWFSAVSSPVLENERLVFDGVVFDNTDRKRAEYELLKKNEELNASYEQIAASEEELRGQYEELVRSEQLIRESEEKFKTLFESAGDAIFIIDHDIILDCNRRAEAIFGKTRDQIIGNSPVVLSPECQLDGQRSAEKAKEKFDAANLGEPQFFDWVHVHSNGSPFYAEVSLNRVIVGGKYYTQAIIRDITERKQVEEMLRKNEEQLRNTIDLVNDGIQINQIGSDGKPGKFIEVNEVACRMLQYTREELLERGPFDIVTGYHSRPLPEILEELSSTGHSFFETEHRRKDGTVVPVEINANIVNLLGQQQVISVVRDITEHKRVEKALRESEHFNSSILKLTPNMVYIRDLDEHRNVYTNKGIVDTLGYTSEQLTNLGPKWYLTLLHPDDIQKMSRHYNQMKTKKDSDVVECEYRMKHANGTWVIHRNQDVVFLRNQQGEVTQILGSAEDITKRKMTEGALAESESFNRGLVDNLPEYLSIYGQDGKILYVNPASARALGFEADEVIGTHILSYVSEEYRESVTARMAARQEGGDISSYETEMITKDGRRRSVIVKASPIQYQNNPATLLLLIDITERKRDEEALQQSEARFRTIIHSMQFGIVIIDAKTHTILEANAKALEMIGSSNDTIVGSICHRFICPAETGRCPVTDLGQNVDSSERILLNLRGEKVPILKSVIKTMLGGKEVLIESFIDITERKRVEAALKESEEKYRFLIDNSHDIIYTLTPQGIFTFVSTAWTALLGHPVNGVVGKSFQQFVHPDDIAECWAFMQRTTDTGERQTGVEYRVQHADGSWRWHTSNGVPLKDESGMIVGFEGSASDITGKKELEKEKEYNEQELRKFSTSLAAANKKLIILSSITRHDINNQLTVLMGFLTMLKKKQPDLSVSEYFVKVSTAAQRISSMIQFTKEYESIGVNAPAWQDCRTLADTAAKEAPLGKVIVKNDLPVGTEVFADPLIVKVFYNLMDNAVRYGGKITTIRFSVEEREEDHIVVCEDDGDGVPAQEKERIFDSGFGKNTGLGLALSLEILSITGITITETGEPGKGARFEMTVPKGAYRLGAVQ